MLEPRELLNGQRVAVDADVRRVEAPRFLQSRTAAVAHAEPQVSEGSADRAEIRTGDRARSRRTSPEFDQSEFVSRIGNPYFPLVPGTTFIYRGTSDGERTRNETFVTYETKEILGVTATVVRDRAFVGGELVEETFDWFAQDSDGNVWYLGEDSNDIENGVVVSKQGSWEAGVNGARPGIIMEARPRAGDFYRQELARGVAEDRAVVLSLREQAAVPYGSFDDCLKTKDFTPLEPGVVEHKYYCAGVGFVRAVTVQGGSDMLELVRIIRPRGNDNDRSL
jgi:hypothetical protein